MEEKTTEYWVEHQEEYLSKMNEVTGGYTVVCLDCREMCMNERRWSKEELERYVDTCSSGRLDDFAFAPGSIGWIIQHRSHHLRVASIEELYKEHQRAATVE